MDDKKTKLTLFESWRESLNMAFLGTFAIVVTITMFALHVRIDGA